MSKQLYPSKIFKSLNSYAEYFAGVKTQYDLAVGIERVIDELFDQQYSGIYLYDLEAKKLRLHIARGFTEEERLEAERTAMDRHPGDVFRSNKVLYIPDTDKDKTGATTTSKRSFNVKSRIYAPILSGGKPVGTIGIVSDKPNTFDGLDMDLLLFICNLAGIFYTILNQITELKTANEEISSLSKFPTENPNPIMRIDYKHVLIYANVASQPYLNTHNLKIGMTISGDFRSAVTESMLTNEVVELEVRDVNSVYVFVITPVKESRHLNIYGINITERKLIENELRKSSMIAEKTDNAIIITDEAGVTEYVNESFTRMSGYTIQDIIGLKPGKLLQGKDTDKNTVKIIRKAINEGKSTSVEILNYSKDGGQYWIKMEIQPIFSNKNELTNYMSIQTDITHQKNPGKS
ncbi:MAG: PAS domain-containing protein [Bacteroidales bacterium]|nr:PAS domain-containing protein [Bacteroidales bacterium]